jgi:hypothetical protein
MKLRPKMFLVATLLFSGCSEESPAPTFDIKQNTGIWVLYEIVFADGTMSPGPFDGYSVFGAYDPSIELNDDGTYVPLNWNGPGDIHRDEGDGGVYEYFPDESRLVLTGPGSWKLEFEVTHFSTSDLWLRSLGNVHHAGSIYKLHRPPR